MSARGFTLLEVVVATAIFAVVAALAWGGLDTLARSRRALEADGARLASIQRTIGLLERDLRQAAARPVRDAIGQVQPALRGAPAEAEWTRHRGHGGWEGPAPRLERVGWRCQGDALQRLRWPALDRAASAQPELETLLEGVSDCRWRYLERGGTGAQWPVPGMAAPRLPRAVELRFTLDGGDYRRLIELPDHAGAMP